MKGNWHDWLTVDLEKGISPMDGDMMIHFEEEDGSSRFLVIERKSYPEVPTGQARLLNALACLPSHTVYAVVLPRLTDIGAGLLPPSTGASCYRFEGVPGGRYVIEWTRCTVEDLNRLVYDWRFPRAAVAAA